MNVLQKTVLYATAGIVALCCSACGQAPATPAAAIASPTIAAFVPSPTVAGGIAAQPAPLAVASATSIAVPTAVPPRIDAGAATRADETPFTYLWPEYLPEGMQIAPGESRIARDGEVGAGEIGFFILTFNDGARKLVVGGGATDPFALNGQIQAIMVNGKPARLVMSNTQQQIVFEQVQGTLFVLGIGLTEGEIEQIAGALTPIDIREMRARVGE